jgi:hypothetical protein
VLLLSILSVGQNVKDKIDRSYALRPLQAAALASKLAHKPITTITPATSRRWDETDDGSPTEAQVKKLVNPGNAYLEPIFLTLADTHGEPAMSNSDRCYYFPVQHVKKFEVKRVIALASICYSDGDGNSHGGGWIRVTHKGDVAPGPDWGRVPIN